MFLFHQPIKIGSLHVYETTKKNNQIQKLIVQLFVVVIFFPVILSIVRGLFMLMIYIIILEGGAAVGVESL